MRRTKWVIAGQTLLGAVLLVAWLYFVDLGEVPETLGKAQWGYVAAAALVGWSTTYIRAMRWRLIINPIGEVPRVDLWLIGLASSLVNFVIPIRSGELARGLFLKQREGIPVSASLPTVAVDRSLDLLVVLLIGGVGLVSGAVVGGSVLLALGLGAGLLAFFTAFAVAAIIWQDRLTTLIARLLPRLLGEGVRNRLIALLSGMLNSLTAIGRKPGRFVPLIILSLGAALIDASVFYLLFQGIGYPISLIGSVTGYSIFALTFIVPGAPGYVGSFEAFGSLVFGGALGTPQAAAAAVVLIYHAINVIMLGITGVSAFVILGVRPGSVFRSVIGPTYPASAGDVDLG